MLTEEEHGQTFRDTQNIRSSLAVLLVIFVREYFPWKYSKFLKY